MRSFRASDSELERWDAAREQRGMHFSTFVREAIETFIRQPATTARGGLVATSQCSNRVPRGTFCKSCRKVHK